MGRARNASARRISGRRSARGQATPQAVCLLARSTTEPAAFAAFYDRYSDRVLRYFVRRLLDVEVSLDLASETFAKALEQRHKFRGTTTEAEQAWLFAVAQTELSRFWRSGKAERRAMRRIGIDVPTLSDDELELIERREGVQAIASGLAAELDALPPDQRQAVELRVVSELGYEEIAQKMGTTPQVVRARVSRGLRTLAKGLRDRGVDPEDVTE